MKYEFHYKDKTVAAKEIGNELGVCYVLKGLVQAGAKSGARQCATCRRRIRHSSVGPIVLFQAAR
jgi:hypothetical protein